jgi:hypothetical protein
MLQWLHSKLVLNNLKTGKPSYTVTMLVFGFMVINFKLLVSGIDIMGKVKMSSFSGTDYAASLAALAAMHIGNKKITSDIISKDKKE